MSKAFFLTTALCLTAGMLSCSAREPGRAYTKFDVDVAYDAGRERGLNENMNAHPPDTLVLNLGPIGVARDSTSWYHFSGPMEVMMRWERAGK